MAPYNIIDSGKTHHQWMIKLVDEKFDEEQELCSSSLLVTRPDNTYEIQKNSNLAGADPTLTSDQVSVTSIGQIDTTYLLR